MTSLSLSDKDILPLEMFKGMRLRLAESPCNLTFFMYSPTRYFIRSKKQKGDSLGSMLFKAGGGGTRRLDSMLERKMTPDNVEKVSNSQLH